MWGGLCLLQGEAQKTGDARSDAERMEALCQGNKSLWGSVGFWQVLLVLLSDGECGGVSPQGPHVSFKGN